MGERRLHASFQDKGDSLPTYEDPSAGSGIVCATPVSRVSPGGTHTLPGATRLSNLLTAVSGSVHDDTMAIRGLIDRLP